MIWGTPDERFGDQDASKAPWLDERFATNPIVSAR